MDCKKITFISATLLSNILLISPQNLFADGPVKSVDQSGNVTYSDKPVPDAVEVSKVPIIPGPSESEVNAAQQQAEKNITAAKKVDQKNKEQQAKKKAQQQSSAKEQKGTNTTTQTDQQPNTYPIYYPPRNRAPGHRPPGKPPAHKPPNRKPVQLPVRGTR